MPTLRRLVVLSLPLALLSVTALGQGRGVGPLAPAGAPVNPDGSAPLSSGSGAISGVVVDAATGAPIPGAMVSIGSAGRALALPQRGQVADARGRFAFVNLPAYSAFNLTASKMGYLDGGYGRDRSPTDALRNIPLRDGEWAADVRVMLWRPSAISGLVRDEHGDPVVGVYVRALVRARVQGRDDLIAGPVTTTDDRGMYRLAGLSPGRYVIQVPSVQASAPESLAFTPSGSARVIDGAINADGTATRLFIGRYPLPPPPENGHALIYPVAFHPAASAVAQAVAIDLKYGEDRTGIDVVIEPVPASRVSGTVEGPVEALRNLTIRLLPAGLENLGPGSEVATALVDDNGRFMFLNVPAGSYVVDAPRTVSEYRWNNAGRGFTLSSSMPAPPSRQVGWGTTGYATDTPGVTYSVTDFRNGAPNYSGRTTVTVGGSDVTNLVVSLRANANLSGWFKLEFDPAKPVPPNQPQFSAQADPANGSSSLGMPRSQPDPDAFPEEFWIGGLGQGEYWLRVPGTAWVIKSIQWKGREYLDTPFDAATTTDISGVVVTMTNAVPTLSGTVRQPDGAALPSATVLVFPADRALWSNAGLTPPRFKAIAAANSGAFRVTALPAGDYRVVAVPTSVVGAWRDLEFLTSVERVATRVSLPWGGEVVQDLTLRPIK